MTNEAEVIETEAIALRPSMSVGHAMGVAEIVAQVKLIQDVMHKVMTDGEHYGTIPGCGNKKTLLQPGAQKLTMTFRLAPEYQIQEVNLERGHKEYRVICTLKSMGNGAFVGQGVGCCSSMESKYRWRGGSRKCPECGKETIIKGKAEYGGGWLCYAKKGGCGVKWPDGAPEIENQSIEKVENDNPADTFNTVLKMAKKRAFVDATITATAASDIFTQDIGDDEADEAPANAPQSRQDAPGRAARPSADTGKGKITPEAKAAPFPTVQQRDKMIEQLNARPGQADRDLVTEYFRKCDALLPTEELEALPLRFVPVTAGQMRAIGSCVAAFGNGEQAGLAFPPHLEPEAAPTAKAPPLAEGQKQVTGVIQAVHLKEGKSAKGPWSLWGIKINDEWANTFNNTLGKAAQQAKGVEVTMIYTENEKGRTCQDLVFNGLSVMAEEGDA